MRQAEITRALEAKQVLISDILRIPVEDFDKIIEDAVNKHSADNVKGVLLASLQQGEEDFIYLVFN